MGLYVAVVRGTKSQIRFNYSLNPPLINNVTLSKFLKLYYFFNFNFFFFLQPHLVHKEVPRLGVESELQLLAYVTATATLSHICHLCHSLHQCHILT